MQSLNQPLAASSQVTASAKTKVTRLIAKAAMHMDPFPIWGDGLQTRNFTYVQDTIMGMALSGALLEGFEVINVGTEKHHTIMDLLEEIFGDIQDEYDVGEDFIEKQISANEYIFSGRMELDHLTEKYGLTFPRNEEDAETLSGYIIQRNGSIPKQKERIITGNYEFDILHVSGTRIETVKVKLLI